jgi:hypothetical protein
MLRVLIVIFSAWSFSVHADLYRWIDPEAGSVKYSSYPPPWYGDPEQERRAPKVERIPEGKPAASEPVATPANPLEALEERRKRILQQLAAPPGTQDAKRADAGLKQHMEAYAALIAEMDRLDPAGAARRRAETQPILDRMIQGLRSQFGAKPPGVAPGDATK